MLDGKPLLSTASVWVWEKGEGGHVAQSLVHGLLLPKDVHTFKDGTNELLGRRLQWHTIAVTPNSLFFPRFYIILFYFIHVYMYILLFIITILSLHLYLLLLVCQVAQLTHILEGQVRELTEDAKQERALKDAAKATSKEREKIAATAEKKAAASEKARVSAEKRFSDLEAKLGETELKLAKAVSLNTARVEDLADLRAAFEGCESK